MTHVLTKKNESTLVMFCIIAALFFHITSLRPGHNWGGDFSQYIQHAKQLISGQPYSELGYIYSVENPVGPKAYPPGLPLVLAPVLSIFGLNFIALKSIVALFFGLVLYAHWKLSRAEMPRWWAIGCMVFLAMSPRMLKFSNNVLSDVPFMGFTLLALWAGFQFFNTRPNWRNAVYAIITITIACAFRTTGIVLVGAFLAYAVLFRRTHLAYAIGVTVLATTAILAIYHASQCGGTYVEHLSFKPSDLWQYVQRNTMAYKRGLLRFLAPYPSRNEGSIPYLIINNTTLLLFIGLVGIGLSRNIKRLQFHDVFVAAYVAMILLYRWNQSIRYLFPIIPILILHAFVGLRFTTLFLRKQLPSLKKIIIRFHVSHRLRPLVPAGLYAPVFLVYWLYVMTYPVDPGANILLNPDVSNLFQTVEKQQSDISGVIFSHPRVLRLFTGARTATCYNTEHIHWDIHSLIDYASEQKISHLIVSSFNPMFYDLISKNREHFQSVYHNNTFEMYRIVSTPSDPIAATSSMQP